MPEPRKVARTPGAGIAVAFILAVVFLGSFLVWLALTYEDVGQ